jgi:hypothetical protein
MWKTEVFDGGGEKNCDILNEIMSRFLWKVCYHSVQSPYYGKVVPVLN